MDHDYTCNNSNAPDQPIRLMGMFDYIMVDRATLEDINTATPSAELTAYLERLPPDETEREFQTKDLDNFMRVYRVRGGSLFMYNGSGVHDPDDSPQKECLAADVTTRIVALDIMEAEEQTPEAVDITVRIAIHVNGGYVVKAELVDIRSTAALPRIEMQKAAIARIKQYVLYRRTIKGRLSHCAYCAIRKCSQLLHAVAGGLDKLSRKFK